jgi:hypothetical protein
MPNPNLTIFSQAWNDTLSKFDDLRAVEIMMTARNMGFRITQSKLTQFKQGDLDVKSGTLQTILMSLKLQHPVAFNFYMERVKELFGMQTIDSVVTIDVNYQGVSRDEHLELVYEVHDYLQEREISFARLAEDVGIDGDRLSQIMQGAEPSIPEFHRIKSFLLEKIKVL